MEGKITMDDVSCRIDGLAAIAELASQQLGEELCALRGESNPKFSAAFAARVGSIYYPILDALHGELFDLKVKVSAAL